MDVQSIIQMVTVVVAILGSAALLGIQNARLVEQIDKRIQGLEKRLDARIDQLEKRMDDRMSQLEKRMEDRMNQLEKRMEQSERNLIARFEDLKDRFTDLKELVVGRLEIKSV